MRRALVTGMSGTGSRPCWQSWADAVSARPSRASPSGSPRPTVGGGECLWREDRIAEPLASEGAGTLYASGCVANQGTFSDRFDAIVLLSAPPDVILGRIEKRTTNDYAKRRGERDLILSQLVWVEPLLRAACTHEIDAGRPLADVVEALVRVGATPAV